MPIRYHELKKEPIKNREIKPVKATLIHTSTILPKRSRVHEVMNSVKNSVIEQPIVVRPHPTRSARA